MKVTFLVTLVTYLHCSVWASDPTQSTILTTTSGRGRFSRLLHENADTLRSSSISTERRGLLPNSVHNHILESFPEGNVHPSAPAILSRASKRRPFTQQIITTPEQGNEYVYIRKPNIKSANPSSEENASVADLNNSKPHRVPISVVRKTMSTRGVNFAPSFSHQQITNPKPQFVSLEESKSVEGEETTIIPEVEETTMPPTAESIRAPAEGRTKMIINVVTSAPRTEIKSPQPTSSVTSSQSSSTTVGVEDNIIYRARKVPQFNGLRRTFPSVVTDGPSTTTTSTTTEKPTTSTTTQSSIHENLVVDTINRAGQAFLDFDDGPIGGLHAAASSQPARVNVRPAPDGDEYEYEYIYYYYDDEDGDNATSTADKAGRQPAPTVSTTTTTTTTEPSTTTTTTTTTTAAPIFQKQPFEQIGNGFSKNVAPSNLNSVRRGNSGEKFGDSNGSNGEKTRDPKLVRAEQPDVSASNDEYDYVYEYVDYVAPNQLPGDPQRPQEYFENAKVSGPVGSAALDPVPNPTHPDARPNSFNQPIVLKQSNLLTSVPASQLAGAFVEPSTTTTTTTTTTTPAPTTERATFRGRHRVRGSTESPEDTATPETKRNRFHDPTSRRRFRPTHHAESVEQTPEPVVSTAATLPQRHTPSRARFPVRSSVSTSVATSAQPQPTSSLVSTIEPTYSVESSVQPETNKEDEGFVRGKSVNDLYTFSRLQNAIHSRNGGREELAVVGHKAVPVSGFITSKEQSDVVAIASAEATTTSPASDSGSQEIKETGTPAIATTTTTTTTTTTEAPSSERPTRLNRFGSRPQFGGARRRFQSRTRTTEAPSEAQSNPTPTPEEENSAAKRNRFTGRRRFRPTTEQPAAGEKSEDETNAEQAVSKPPTRRIPPRNRFALRRRTTTTTEAPAEEEVEAKEEESNTAAEEDTAPHRRQRPLRRRPGRFQGRRRFKPRNQASAEEENEEAQSITTETKVEPAAEEQNTRARPVGPGRRRFNFNQRSRPGGRIRGRFGPTSTTAESPVEVPEEEDPNVENSDVPSEVQNDQTAETPEEIAPTVEHSPSIAPTRGSAGVLGRLRSRSRGSTTTTTPAPEATPRARKPSRLDGILNRRRKLNSASQAPSTTSAPEPVSEAEVEQHENSGVEIPEELAQHKGVVVQVSSSVREEEQVAANVNVESAHPPVQGSILSRLRSQRRPGSLFSRRSQQTDQQK